MILTWLYHSLAGYLNHVASNHQLIPPFDRHLTTGESGVEGGHSASCDAGSVRVAQRLGQANLVGPTSTRTLCRNDVTL